MQQESSVIDLIFSTMSQFAFCIILWKNFLSTQRSGERRASALSIYNPSLFKVTVNKTSQNFLHVHITFSFEETMEIYSDHYKANNVEFKDNNILNYFV